MVANRDTVSPPGIPNPTNSFNIGLPIHGEGLNSEYLPSAHQQLQNTTQKCNSIVDSGLLLHEHIDHPSNPAFLSTSGYPIYNNVEPGRSTTSPKQSSGIGSPVLVGLLGLCLWLGLASTTDCADEPIRRKLILGVYN